jgi:hypothetical protein
MSRFLRRLQKLERRFLEITGLVPHSREWFAHWEGKIDRVIAGEQVDLHGMPLAIVESIIEAGEEGLKTW